MSPICKVTTLSEKLQESAEESMAIQEKLSLLVFSGLNKKNDI